jgi:hypothetical protein
MSEFVIVGVCWLSLVTGATGIFERSDVSTRIHLPAGVDGPVTMRGYYERLGCEIVRDTFEFGDRWTYYSCPSPKSKGRNKWQ